MLRLVLLCTWMNKVIGTFGLHSFFLLPIEQLLNVCPKGWGNHLIGISKNSCKPYAPTHPCTGGQDLNLCTIYNLAPTGKQCMPIIRIQTLIYPTICCKVIRIGDKRF